MRYRRSVIRCLCVGTLLGTSLLFATPAVADPPPDDRSFAGAVDTMIRLFTQPLPAAAPVSHRPPRAVERVRPVPFRPDAPALTVTHAQAAPVPVVARQVAAVAHIVRVRQMPVAARANFAAVGQLQSLRPAPLIAPLRAVSACHAAVMHCLNIDVR